MMASFLDGHGGYCTCTREKCTDDCATYRRFKPKPTTNADRIRAMSNEELSEAFMNLERYGAIHNAGRTKQWWMGWLKQEAKE